MPRTATLNPKTRAKLLDAATELMLSRGYNGTSVDDICASAGLTKGSFFHYFESKEDLGRAALKRFCDEKAAMFMAAVGSQTDPWKRVLAYLDAIEAFSKDPRAACGCLLAEMTAEMCDCSSSLRGDCCGAFESWIGAFAGELAAAKKATAPRASWNPREVAEHFVATLEGALLLAKAKRDPEVVGRNVRHFRSYVKGLCGK